MADKASQGLRVATSAEERFAELYSLYRHRITDYCARRTDRARLEDAVSETFLVAWQKLDDVPEGDRALLWLYGVAFRVLQHQWRSTSRGRRLIDRLGGVAQEVAPGADVTVLRREEHRLVLEAAAHLGPTDQEILRLTLWEELTLADVAVVLDIRVGAVKQRALRARRNLLKEFRRLAKEDFTVVPARDGGRR
jgi:RNA polymerase sigma-70 factor (ECF subfamily)